MFRLGCYLVMASGLLRVLRQAKWTDPGFFTLATRSISPNLVARTPVNL